MMKRKRRTTQTGRMNIKMKA